MIAFLKTIIYIPLYNILILILNVSWIDAGLAAVILTLLVKFILYPLAKKSMVAQAKMKEGNKELELIKEKYKNKEEQALKMMEFYKKNNINPFSSILTIFIQIPIIYSLYYIFYRSGLPNVDTSLLYSFVNTPASISMNFLGLMDVSQKSIILAALAAISSFFQMHFSASSMAVATQGQNKAEDFSQMMAKQMKFTFPIMIFLISWRISGVVALYWFVSNVIGMIQEAYIRRQISKSSVLATK